MKINKTEVEEILVGLGHIADRPEDKKGNLDIEAFNNLPEVKKTIIKLKQLGVTKKWLSEHGFMIACMVLHF